MSGEYAYVADSYGWVMYYDAGLRVIDVSTPSEPVEVGFYGTYSALGVALSGEYAYVADSSAGMEVFHIAGCSETVSSLPPPRRCAGRRMPGQ